MDFSPCDEQKVPRSYSIGNQLNFDFYNCWFSSQMHAQYQQVDYVDYVWTQSLLLTTPDDNSESVYTSAVLENPKHKKLLLQIDRVSNVHLLVHTIERDYKAEWQLKDFLHLVYGTLATQSINNLQFHYNMVLVIPLF